MITGLLGLLGLFTPEERKQIDRIVDLGFVDGFRLLDKSAGHYT
jgi:exonuclease III